MKGHPDNLYDRLVAGSVLTYDVAVSFAGAQREQVRRVVRACRQLGLKVFFDEDKAVELWGRNIIYNMREVYGGAHARYFMPFLSKEYLASPYPMDEFHTAAVRALEINGDSYILPIRVGDVRIPPTLLSPAIMYIQFEKYTIKEWADIIATRVGIAPTQHEAPSPDDQAVQIRLPRLPTADFSVYETLETALAHAGALFQQSADMLTPYGVRCLVRTTDTMVDVRVERQGRPICGLRLWFGTSFHTDQLLMAFAWPRISGNSHNGSVTAEWDPDSGRPALRFTDFGSQGRDSLTTADELFHRLWAKIIDHLEQTSRQRW